MGFNTYCIGVGKAGICSLAPICALDVKSGVKQISPLGLASSKFDYDLADTLGIKEFVLPFLALTRLGIENTGVGSDQHLATEVAIEDGRRILVKIKQDIEMNERKNSVYAITLIGSLEEGTGGGAIPVLAKMIKDNFPEKLIVIMGILPEEQEGKISLANVSRSLRVILKLKEMLSDKFVDCVFLFGKENSGMYRASDFAERQLAYTLNVLFSSIYGSRQLDLGRKLSILKDGCKEGIGMMRYTTIPWTDMETDDLRSEIKRVLEKNLGEYPPGIVESGKYGIYQVRCDQNIFPLDVRDIMSDIFKECLQESSSNNYVEIKGEMWLELELDTMETATMILGIDPARYEYLNKIKDMWKLLYDEEEVAKDIEQINNMEIII